MTGGGEVQSILPPGLTCSLDKAAISFQICLIKPVVIFYAMMVTLLGNYILRIPQSRLITCINSHLSDLTHNPPGAVTHSVIFHSADKLQMKSLDFSYEI